MNWTLITGAGHHLGSSIALALAKNNYNVIIHYNTHKENAETIVQLCRSYGVQAEMIRGNFASQEGIESFTKELTTRFSSIKNLINSAGIFIRKPLLETSMDEWHQLFQINLFSPVTLVNALIPYIHSSKGNILNIGSSGLHMKASTFDAAYMASKASLLLFTKSLAKELAPAHVRVNMISPGQQQDSMVVFDKLPMQRAGSGEDIANMVLFLLDEANSYITGQNIEIAGGLGL